MLQTLISFKNRLEVADYSKKGEVLAELSTLTGWSRDKCYRELAKVGYSTSRKKRVDKGKTKLTDEQVKLIASMKFSSQRKNGKNILETPTAVGLLAENGISLEASHGTINRVLRQHNLNNQALNLPNSHKQLATERPNHMHQVDVSLCTMYYSPRGLETIKAEENYKNKDFWADKKKVKLWRYLLTDHYSCSIVVRYYEASGETQANMWDFLLYAWGKKDSKQLVFHGVPEFLYWDKGAANTARAIKNAVGKLGIEEATHEVGKARAKGQVETMHNIVEKVFESRLVFQRPQSVEELNGLVENWCGAYNANTLQAYDSKLKRGTKGFIRLALWSQIKAKDIRELPDKKTCFALLAPKPIEVTVGGDLSIRFRHPMRQESGSGIYHVGNMQGVRVRGKVSVTPQFFGKLEEILVESVDSYGEVFEKMLVPIEVNEAGFRLDSQRLGAFKANKQTSLEAKVDELKDFTYGTIKPKPKAVPLQDFNDGEGFKSLDNLKLEPKIEVMQKTGEIIKVEANVHDRLLTHFEAVKILATELKWQPSYTKELKQKYPNGIRESELADAKKSVLITQSKIVNFKTG